MHQFSSYVHIYILFCGFFVLGSFLRWPTSEKKMLAALLLGLAAAVTTHGLLLQL
jgi:hypothetical protein